MSLMLPLFEPVAGSIQAMVTPFSVMSEPVTNLCLSNGQKVLMGHISTIVTVAFAFIAMGLVAIDFLSYW
jgi:hypothetical protein